MNKIYFNPFNTFILNSMEMHFKNIEKSFKFWYDEFK